MSGGSDEETVRHLDAVNFGPERLPHPVDVVTYDDVATVAGIPRSTVSSSVRTLERLRTSVLEETIRSVDTAPGPATWAALRAVVRTGERSAIVDLVGARAGELARDPSLPLLLAGFDPSDRPVIAGAVDAVVVDLLASWDEVFDTAAVAVGIDVDRTHPTRPLVSATVLLAEALRQCVTGATDESEIHRHLQTVSTDFLLAALDDRPDDVDPGFPEEGTTAPRLDGVTRWATMAGVDLLRSGAAPIRTGLSVAEILDATGLSAASFYRRFGSLAEFEIRLVEHTGRGLADGFRDEFFDSLLVSAESGEMAPAEAFARFAEESTVRTADHVEEGRPGRQVTPWLGVPAVAPSFRAAFDDAFTERGEFYRRFLGLAGVEIPAPLDGAAVARILNCYSVVGDGLIRHCRDRAVALDYWGRESVRFQSLLVSPR